MAALAAAEPAYSFVSPGHVALSIATQVPQAGVAAGGAGPAVAPPDGGSVMIVSDAAFAGITTVALRADSALEFSYGVGGIARVAVADLKSVHQLLRQADGGLVVVASRAPAGHDEPGRLVLVRLTVAGAPDPSFGIGGIAVLDVQSSCAQCRPAALAPDGSIVVTGTSLPYPPSRLTPPRGHRGSSRGSRRRVYLMRASGRSRFPAKRG